MPASDPHHEAAAPGSGGHRTRSGLPPRCRLARWRAWATVGLLGASCVLYLGCSPDTRYKVLSFFFDGVPSPNAQQGKPQETQAPWVTLVDPTDPLAFSYLEAQKVARSVSRGEIRAAPPASEHVPYKGRDCFSCHETDSSLVASSNTSALCRKCHAAYVDPAPSLWVHGPTSLGQCKICHEPHKSQFVSLLTRPERELCSTCHTQSDLLQVPIHKVSGGKACSTCHDPHMSGNRLLLVDSGVYKRRQVEKRPSLEHAPWKEHKCTVCHLPEQSNVLVADIDQACLSCHAKVKEEAIKRNMHKAVQEGKCSVCHSPHRSPLPGLVRTTAEQMCLGCHKPEETRKPGHPPVGKADCLLCHKGHESSSDHLLREGIPWSPSPRGDVAQSSPPAMPEAASEAPHDPVRPEP